MTQGEALRLKWKTLGAHQGFPVPTVEAVSHSTQAGNSDRRSYCGFHRREYICTTLVSLIIAGRPSDVIERKFSKDSN